MSTGAARPRRLFALVDGSALYCSCERVFGPSLEGVPVAVLSNNDGCVIARSQEVKDGGVKMGALSFEARADLEDMGARVFSSNDRPATVTPDVEVYSVDEAFLAVPTPGGAGVQRWALRLGIALDGRAHEQIRGVGEDSLSDLRYSVRQVRTERVRPVRRVGGQRDTVLEGPDTVPIVDGDDEPGLGLDGAVLGSQPH